MSPDQEETIAGEPGTGDDQTGTASATDTATSDATAEAVEDDARIDEALRDAAGVFPMVEQIPEAAGADEEKCIELLRDVSLKVKVELGRGQMFLRDILRLTQGSVVELEKNSGDPLDIYVNNRLIARGEVLVLHDQFCVRVTEILTPEECFRVRPA